ncbi:MAG: FAD-dependent oxidoreductase, partial [Candidatus Moranbacteria bacterium]|nr:FAD-dependent oxidoreductase [Candidatus Moranbacteria bacterium]
MEKRQVYIIGGGASGMLAALAAASSGSRVTILERNKKLGKKILATGNGRCNFTNINAQPEDYNHPSFVKPALEQFGVDKTIDFFERIGIFPKIEDYGKTYPLSEQALSINLLLEKEILHQSIQVVYDTQVEKIIKSNHQFTIQTKDSTYVADRIVIACGGMSLPQSG